jgi:hypothetical protein
MQSRRYQHAVERVDHFVSKFKVQHSLTPKVRVESVQAASARNL